jgi:hypothetical protein
MADAAMVANLSTLAAVSAAGAAAASAGASRSRYRRAQSACYQGTSLNTASYMNNLRTPAYPLRSPGASNGRGGGGGGIGVHIHYHGRCPHHYDLRRSPSPPDDGLFSPYSERDYTYPQDYCPSRYPSYKGYPGSDCGCTQCYWRDFVS